MLNSGDIHKGKVLIVDDQEVNVMLLEHMLRGAGYECLTTTTDPVQVCDLHRKNNYDLILLDLQMPVMDGFEVMEGLKEIEPEGYLPVLVVTAQPAHKLRALQAGAKDFVSKPFEVAEVLARVHSLLEVRLLHERLLDANDVLEHRVRARTADLQTNYLETIFTLTRAAERKDEDTGAHVKRISYYSREFAKLLGLDGEFVDKIFFASPMHDIGKIGIPDHILLKPRGLTPEEWVVMKGHASMGSGILGSSNSPYLVMGAEIALNHHERWCGGGYPSDRRGDDIPLSARIENICDIYDALRSQRPYKPALGHQETVDIIVRGDGRTLPEHFDPVILDAFTKNDRMFSDVFEAYQF